jgi:uncharacterized protein YutE (UPF0331/DUF86 family)
MEKLDLDRQLTPAARQVLDELVSEYRNQILLGARESASELTGEVQEISVHDIIEGVNRRRTDYPGGVSGELDEWLYKLIGIVVGLVGLSVSLYLGLARSLEPELRIALFTSFLGFGTAGLVYFYSKVKKSRQLRSELKSSLEQIASGYSLSFIKKWQLIEMTIRDLVASRFGESSADEPISVLIVMLHQDGVLDQKDGIILKDLLSARNKVLHEGLEIERDEFEMLSRYADRILSKLRKTL